MDRKLNCLEEFLILRETVVVRSYPKLALSAFCLEKVRNSKVRMPSFFDLVGCKCNCQRYSVVQHRWINLAPLATNLTHIIWGPLAGTSISIFWILILYCSIIHVNEDTTVIVCVNPSKQMLLYYEHSYPEFDANPCIPSMS